MNNRFVDGGQRVLICAQGALDLVCANANAYEIGVVWIPPTGGQPRGIAPTGGQLRGIAPTGGQPRGIAPTGGQPRGIAPTGGQPRGIAPTGGYII